MLAFDQRLADQGDADASSRLAKGRRGIGKTTGCRDEDRRPGYARDGLSLSRAAQAPSSIELAAVWKPYFDKIASPFGPQRCRFESNFPVDKGMFSYATFWNACKRLSAGFSAQETASLFFDAAARIYLLDRAGVLN